MTTNHFDTYNFDNFYEDCYSTSNENEILYSGRSPIIIITDDLIFYSGDVGTNERQVHRQKVYYNVKNNLNESITIHDAFKQIDIQVGINMKNPILADYYECNDHRFIEHVDKINDITFQIDCGS
tara:strand:- start:91 stop:465 length:375 start_codon:yes stop_codon:yes gene_type:complete